MSRPWAIGVARCGDGIRLTFSAQTIEITREQARRLAATIMVAAEGRAPGVEHFRRASAQFGAVRPTKKPDTL